MMGEPEREREREREIVRFGFTIWVFIFYNTTSPLSILKGPQELYLIAEWWHLAAIAAFILN